MRRPRTITVHAWERRAQRAPRAAHPNFGLVLSRAQARRLGVGPTWTAGDRARNRRQNRGIRRNERHFAPLPKGVTFRCTATACWVMRGDVAVTVVAIDDEALASLLVWAAMGVWP